MDAASLAAGFEAHRAALIAADDDGAWRRFFRVAPLRWELLLFLGYFLWTAWGGTAWSHTFMTVTECDPVLARWDAEGYAALWTPAVERCVVGAAERAPAGWWDWAAATSRSAMQLSVAALVDIEGLWAAVGTAGPMLACGALAWAQGAAFVAGAVLCCWLAGGARTTGLFAVVVWTVVVVYKVRAVADATALGALLLFPAWNLAAGEAVVAAARPGVWRWVAAAVALGATALVICGITLGIHSVLAPYPHTPTTPHSALGPENIAKRVFMATRRRSRGASAPTCAERGAQGCPTSTAAAAHAVWQAAASAGVPGPRSAAGRRRQGPPAAARPGGRSPLSLCLHASCQSHRKGCTRTDTPSPVGTDTKSVVWPSTSSVWSTLAAIAASAKCTCIHVFEVWGDQSTRSVSGGTPAAAARVATTVSRITPSSVGPRGRPKHTCSMHSASARV